MKSRIDDKNRATVKQLSLLSFVSPYFDPVSGRCLSREGIARFSSFSLSSFILSFYGFTCLSHGDMVMIAVAEEVRRWT